MSHHDVGFWVGAVVYFGCFVAMALYGEFSLMGKLRNGNLWHWGRLTHTVLGTGFSIATIGLGLAGASKVMAMGFTRLGL